MRIYLRTNPGKPALRVVDDAGMVPRVGECVQVNGFRWIVTDVVWDFESEHPVEVDVFMDLKTVRHKS